MTELMNITFGPDQVVYEPKTAKKHDFIDIDRDIWDPFFNIVIGRKVSYLLYRSGNLQGYCHSLKYGMDVIKNMITSQIEKGNTYKIVIKKDEKLYKIYLYQVVEGYIYTSNNLIEKYRLLEIPRIELKNK